MKNSHGVIVIDSRERDLVTVASKFNLDFVIQPLPVGDVVVESVGGYRFTIERKTFPDFVSSMRDGRLDNQLARLVTVEYPVMIVEMNGKVFSKMNRNAIMAKLAKVGLSRVRIIPTRNIYDTVRVLRYMAKIDEDLRFDFNRPKRGVTKRDLSENQIFVLSGFPGVGRKRAIEILSAYGSLREALRHIDEWRVPKNAKRDIKRLLDHRFIGELHEV